MPVVLLGCIYTGITTPTEAAAIAAAYALLVSVVIYRSVTMKSFYDSLLSSARTTASIGMLIAGALVFNYVVTVENIPHTIRDLLQGLELSPLTFMIFVNLLLLVLGCLLEGTTIILIVLPVLIPTAQALGIDLVYFGIVAVVNIMLGLITPPYGLLLFIMSNISGEPLRAIVKETHAVPRRHDRRTRSHYLGAGDHPLAPARARLSGRPGILMKPIYVLNGPNLNRLGKREPEIYGTTTLAEVEAMCREAAGERPLVFAQTNSEEKLIDLVHEAIDEAAGILINPAAFTFTSLALLDALKMFPGPDHRVPHLQHPPPRADLSPLLRLDDRDCRHGRPRRRGLRDGGPRPRGADRCETPIAPMKTSIATVSISGDLADKLAGDRRGRLRRGRDLRERPPHLRRAPAEDAAQMARDLGLEITLFQPFRDFEGLPEPQRGTRLRPRRAQVRHHAGARHRPHAHLFERLARCARRHRPRRRRFPRARRARHGPRTCASATRRWPGAATSTTIATPGRSCAAPTIPMSA